SAYDAKFDLIGESSTSVIDPSLGHQTCSNLFPLVTGIKELGHRRGVSGFCASSERPYYAIIVPVNPDAPTGYLQVVVDPIDHLTAIEKVLGMPLRLGFSGAKLYESNTWPQSATTDRILTVDYIRQIYGSDQTVTIAATKDITPFQGKLTKTRYVVMVAAVAITLIAVMIALMILQRTALNPLQALTDQLRKVRQDKAHLGQPVQVTGNAEVSELAAGFNEMTIRLRELYESLEHMAFTDPLTKLPNRMLFHDRLHQAILNARREHRSFALLIMDLDRFKEINDTLGHHVGDLILEQVGERLRDKLRASDTVARMGGDEFAVLLGAVDRQQAEMAARMLIKALRPPFMVEEQRFEIGASIGITLYPDHGEEASVLTQRADVAMYAAKNTTCEFVFYTSALDQHMPKRLALMGELRQAVDYEEFVVYYQPKVNLQTGHVAGVEALVRWQHPTKDILLPDTFIPLMEQSGLIRSLTPIVLTAALKGCRDWQKAGLDIPVSVNFSTRDLQDPFLGDNLSDLVNEQGIQPEWLELEVTESTVMADPARAMDILSDIASKGVQIAIDDFGTGYSSLGYLKKLPISAVKIDRSFVIGMTEDEHNATIVRSSIDLAHNMGLKVVAEGVENADVVANLTNLGCDAAQGMFISRPMPVDELLSWLKSSTWGKKLPN
ncbi:MAG: EAL domain-containing protein, partial [Acidiferrobacterales bacterium]